MTEANPRPTIIWYIPAIVLALLTTTLRARGTNFLIERWPFGHYGTHSLPVRHLMIPRLRDFRESSLLVHEDSTRLRIPVNAERLALEIRLNSPVRRKSLLWTNLVQT